jgi:hypothetical protein
MAMFSSSAKSEDECAEVVSNGDGAVEIQRRRSEQLTTIHVHNFPLDCVRAVLHYCYHGCLDGDDGEEDGWEKGRHSEGRDVQIFQLADKCGVVGLKEMMEGRLARKVTHSNVVQIALLADTHSAPGLKKVCCFMLVHVVCNLWYRYFSLRHAFRWWPRRVSWCWRVPTGSRWRRRSPVSPRNCLRESCVP